MIGNKTSTALSTAELAIARQQEAKRLFGSIAETILNVAERSDSATSQQKQDLQKAVEAAWGGYKGIAVWAASNDAWAILVNAYGPAVSNEIENFIAPHELATQVNTMGVYASHAILAVAAKHAKQITSMKRFNDADYDILLSPWVSVFGDLK